MYICIYINIYIYIGGLMEYISKKSCIIWTVCPCSYYPWYNNTLMWYIMPKLYSIINP